MASLDFDQKFLGRIAKQTADSNPLLSASLYQILGLSVLLARRLVRARKLRKLDTSRDTPSLALYQHILWLSREGLSILELCVLPYAQDNQHGPECRVLSVKLRASFYHIFCLFHNQPPVTATNMPSTDSRMLGVPLLPAYERPNNGQARNNDGTNLSPSSKRAGKQPVLREPIDSIVSETSFVTNPYAAGGPVGTPSPAPPNAPPGFNHVPIPQPSSFILPPLNFVPLAGGYFTTASGYATQYLPGSHPLRLSVALEHSAFLWDCMHDHDESRRVARRAIKDVYRAQEAMDDSEFEDAAELVGILGRMMKRKSWESTPRVGGLASPEPAGPVPPVDNQSQKHSKTSAPSQGSPRTSRQPAADSLLTASIPETPPAPIRSRANSANKANKAGSRQKEGVSLEGTPRSTGQNFSGGPVQDTTPRARHTRTGSGASTTPRAPQGNRSPQTPSTVRSIQQHRNGSSKGSPNMGNHAPVSPSAAAMHASNTARASPTLRRSPPLRQSPQASPMQYYSYTKPDR